MSFVCAKGCLHCLIWASSLNFLVLVNNSYHTPIGRWWIHNNNYHDNQVSKCMRGLSRRVETQGCRSKFRGTWREEFYMFFDLQSRLSRRFLVYEKYFCHHCFIGYLYFLKQYFNSIYIEWNWAAAYSSLLPNIYVEE